MKFTIKSVFHHGRTDKMTTQTEWHVAGEIDGNPVEFRYLDAGNNAEYDREAGLTMTEGDKRRYERALLNWIMKDESILVDLKPGDSIALRSPLPPAVARQRGRPAGRKGPGGWKGPGRPRQ